MLSHDSCADNILRVILGGRFRRRWADLPLLASSLSRHHCRCPRYLSDTVVAAALATVPRVLAVALRQELSGSRQARAAKDERCSQYRIEWLQRKNKYKGDSTIPVDIEQLRANVQARKVGGGTEPRARLSAGGWRGQAPAFSSPWRNWASASGSWASIASCPSPSRPVLARPVLVCPVLACPFLACPGLSCPFLACPVLACPFLSYDVIPRTYILVSVWGQASHTTTIHRMFNTAIETIIDRRGLHIYDKGDMCMLLPLSLSVP